MVSTSPKSKTLPTSFSGNSVHSNVSGPRDEIVKDEMVEDERLEDERLEDERVEDEMVGGSFLLLLWPFWELVC